MHRKSDKTKTTVTRETVARAISDTRIENERMEAWKVERAFIDQWMARGPVPAQQRRWRREDLYDRKGLR